MTQVNDVFIVDFANVNNTSYAIINTITESFGRVAYAPHEYEIPFTKDEPVDPYYIAKLIMEHFGYKVDINNDEDFMDIVNRNRVILRKIK